MGLNPINPEERKALTRSRARLEKIEPLGKLIDELKTSTGACSGEDQGFNGLGV